MVLEVAVEKAPPVLVLLGEGLPLPEGNSPQHGVVRPTVGLKRGVRWAKGERPGEEQSTDNIDKLLS